jgi:hypothetical protein
LVLDAPQTPTFPRRLSVSNRIPVELTIPQWHELVGPLSFGNNDHPNIFRLANDSQNEISSEQPAPGAMIAATEEDLRNLISARKIDDPFRGVIALQDSRLDMEVSREI